MCATTRSRPSRSEAQVRDDPPDAFHLTHVGEASDHHGFLVTSDHACWGSRHEAPLSSRRARRSGPASALPASRKCECVSPRIPRVRETHLCLTEAGGPGPYDERAWVRGLESADAPGDTARHGVQRRRAPLGLSDAAGRAAFFPARAAARVWRGPLEDAVDGFPVGAGEQPASSTGHSQVRCQRSSHARSSATAYSNVLIAELAASGELERLVTATLASPKTSKSPTRCLRATRRNTPCATSLRAPKNATRSPARRKGSPMKVVGAVVLRPCGSTTAPSRSFAADREPNVRSTVGSRRVRSRS